MAAKTTDPLPLLLLLLLLLGVGFPASEAIDTLYAPGALFSGQAMINGFYVFRMQADCNLVLYDRGRAIWASNTNGKGFSCVMRMQRDGNLVVYTHGGTAVWSSGTYRAPANYVLRLQTDRNVVIYAPDGKAIWSTNTYIRGKLK